MEVQGNKTCQVCVANPATHFCDCQNPPTVFCSDCSSRHSGKTPAIFHQIGPIAALGRNKDYKRKYNALMKAAAELRKNVNLIDQCCYEFDDMIKGCTKYLVDYHSWWTQQMQREKEKLSADIEAAVQETTDCLIQNTEPNSPLAWALWTLLPQEMQVINCSVTAPNLQTILQTCISYQNNLQVLCERGKPEAMRDSAADISLPAPNSPPKDIFVVQPHVEEDKYAIIKDTRAVQPEEESATELILVTDAFLCFFDFHTSSWNSQVRLRTAIQADGYSSWAMLEGCVFCCGGYNIAAAYLLASDGAVEQKADMSVARHCHGLLTAYNAAYVFGGLNQRTCEKWEVVTNKWRELPSMREERFSFNPCLWEGRMYLCCYGNMEVFAPQTDTFLPLLIPLPDSHTACCAYVHNHLLVVHSDTYIFKFAVGPDGQLTQCSQVSSPEISKFQNSQPVVDMAKGVFYIIWDGKCVSFQMETGVGGPTVALE